MPRRLQTRLRVQADNPLHSARKDTPQPLQTLPPRDACGKRHHGGHGANGLALTQISVLDAD